MSPGASMLISMLMDAVWFFMRLYSIPVLTTSRNPPVHQSGAGAHIPVLITS
jgi:hypothetical protein